MNLKFAKQTYIYIISIALCVAVAFTFLGIHQINAINPALAASNYTITYNANGGTLTGNSTVTATEGSTITLPNVEKVGYSAQWIDSPTWSSSAMGSASGSAISTRAELAAISGSNSYYLTKDIDLSGSNWTPICSSTAFTGTLDGRGFAIKNMTITSSSTEDVGLFANMNGTLKNIRLLNINITFTSKKVLAGGLVGQISVTGAKISNCLVTGEITNSYNDFCPTGGIVGDIRYWYNATIENCTSEVNITSANSTEPILGGIVGYTFGSTIRNCVNKGTLNATASGSGEICSVGGIVGASNTKTNGNIVMSITNCYNLAKLMGKNYISGIHGMAHSETNLNPTITNCFNAGTLSGGANMYQITSYTSSSISNCSYLLGLAGTTQGTARSASDLASTFYNNLSSSDKTYWAYTSGSSNYPVLWYNSNISGNIGETKIIAYGLDHALTAQYTANTYTINFNGNGASNTMANKSVTYGQGTTISNSFTRTNYTFAGWADSASATTIKYADGFNFDTYPVGVNNNGATFTLYAIWKSTINLDQDGGSNGTTSVTAIEKANMPSATKPTRTDWTFGGYFKEKGGQGAQYYNENMASMHVNDLYTGQTLFAKWECGTVVLDSQGGTGGSANVVPVYNAPMPSATAPTKTGWTFGGYWTQIGGKGTQYYNSSMGSANVWTEATNITLYAKWTASITLNMDGGANGTASIVVTYNAPMPTGVTAPTKTGYAFGGYYTESNGNGTRFYNDEMQSVQDWNLNVSTSLYAKWTPNIYVVTFEYNGANEGNEIENKRVNFGNFYSDLPMPTKTGSSFAGWYLESTFQNAVTSTTVVNTADNHTLFAKWATWLVLHVSGTSETVESVSEINSLYTKATVDIYPTRGQYVSAFSFDNSKWFAVDCYMAEVSDLVFAVSVTYRATMTSNQMSFEINSIYRNYFDASGSIHLYLLTTNTAYESLRASGGGAVVDVAVGATYGGMVSLIGYDYDILGEDDTITFVATVCVAGYRFAGWYPADNSADLLSSEESVSFKKSLVYERQIIARFEPISQNPNLNTDTNN